MSAQPSGASAPLITPPAMDAEARHIVATAQAAGVTLRLIGGLAVRARCREMEFCQRDHSDIDMVGLRAQLPAMVEVFRRLGFVEDQHVAMATANQQVQFSRPCAHGGAAGPVHEDDHIDVFLDAFRMDHEIDLRRRLQLADVTVPVSDLLLTKLQIFKLNEKDLKDIVTLLKDTDEEGSAGAAIDAAYIAGLCAADWGLFYDVATNLGRVSERLPEFALAPADELRVRGRLARLVGAIDAAPKSLRWRVRARVGTRAPWHDEVDEQD